MSESSQDCVCGHPMRKFQGSLERFYVFGCNLCGHVVLVSKADNEFKRWLIPDPENKPKFK